MRLKVLVQTIKHFSNEYRKAIKTQLSSERNTLERPVFVVIKFNIFPFHHIYYDTPSVIRTNYSLLFFSTINICNPSKSIVIDNRVNEK